MEHALAFAETGHLCLSTLHANSANQALDRIINFFSEDRRQQLLMDISLNIKAFVSQRLIPTVDGKRVAAIEILIGTPMVQDLIMKGDIHALKEIMEKSEEQGMQTFDSHLFKLYQQGIISLEEAYKNADSPNNMKVKINLMEDAPDDNVESKAARQSELDSLMLEPILEDEETEEDELEALLRSKAAEEKEMV